MSPLLALALVHFVLVDVTAADTEASSLSRCFYRAGNIVVWTDRTVEAACAPALDWPEDRLADIPQFDKLPDGVEVPL